MKQSVYDTSDNSSENKLQPVPQFRFYLTALFCPSVLGVTLTLPYAALTILSFNSIFSFASVIAYSETSHQPYHAGTAQYNVYGHIKIGIFQIVRVAVQCIALAHHALHHGTFCRVEDVYTVAHELR